MQQQVICSVPIPLHSFSKEGHCSAGQGSSKVQRAPRPEPGIALRGPALTHPLVILFFFGWRPVTRLTAAMRYCVSSSFLSGGVTDSEHALRRAFPLFALFQ